VPLHVTDVKTSPKNDVRRPEAQLGQEKKDEEFALTSVTWRRNINPYVSARLPTAEHPGRRM
jgi:hypothetical protein